jgi:hypothetical protein
MRRFPFVCLSCRASRRFTRMSQEACEVSRSGCGLFDSANPPCEEVPQTKGPCRAEGPGSLHAARQLLRTQEAEGKRADSQVVKRTIVGVLLVLAAGVARGADPDIVLHARVSEVRLTLVATDRDGRPWRGLSVANLRVTDDGQAVTDLQLRSTQIYPCGLASCWM